MLVREFSAQRTLEALYREIATKGIDIHVAADQLLESEWETTEIDQGTRIKTGERQWRVARGIERIVHDPFEARHDT